MDKNNPIAQLSKDFAKRIVKLYQFLATEKHEFTMAKQVMRS